MVINTPPLVGYLRRMQNQVRLFAGLGAAAVALGAFGAHGLQSIVAPEAVATFTTGVRYHFYHTLAIGLALVLPLLPGVNGRRCQQAIWCFVAGIILFSASLYLLALRDYHPIPTALLGPITPVGGLAFIAGWLLLLLSPTKTNPYA